ncbi:probable nucleolar protein 5-1 [Triticum dicoccoides]|uniref:probable nucleolar protein 5-1 n=1 Tax=Triticum dicoccoides TaxID=85692 RepID=UPI00188DD5ED|nr:probable nucleolar protein 5-1 [Triticum dicoccoides]
MKRPRRCAVPPPATAQQRPTRRRTADEVMLLLFETPSGFAVFNFFATLIEQPNALEKIWTDFTKIEKAKKVVWLRQFQTIQDSSSAINQRTGVNASLTEMIMKYHCPGQRMAVGEPGYKKIIEERLKITCVYDPTVTELVWGIQIRMRQLVPREKSYLNEYLLFPMSQGLQNILSRYDCNYVNRDMLNERILIMAYALFECDSFENEKTGDLHHAASVIKDVSGIDTDAWGLLKIATAVKKIWCPEEASNSCEFSEHEVSRLFNDADKYEVKLDKDACLKVSRQMIAVFHFRNDKKILLKKYVAQALDAYEAE